MHRKREQMVVSVWHILTYVIRAATAATVIALVGVITTPRLLARGGGPVWGYSPHGGQSGTFGWGVGWGGINLRSIYGIPHHCLDAPDFTYSSGRSSTFNTGGGATFDRSVFAGSSSDTTVQLPNFNRPPPNAPYRTEKRTDPPYFHNYDSYWHHGFWGGGKWGWGNWGEPMGIWSFTRWSFGPIYYVSGYGQFRNPFLAGQPVPLKPFLDYGKPIEDLPDDEEPAARSASSEPPAASAGNDATQENPQEILNYLVRSPEEKAGLKSFDAAGDAFRKKNYEVALEKTDEALEQLPYDSQIHEFRALVLFARGDYPQAAATVYAVLAVSPGWDWTTLSGRYEDQEEYARHLRQLEAFHKQNPDSAVASFLRGYHYTTCRHTEAAVKHMQNAAKLLPDDLLIPRLAILIAGAQEKSTASTPAAATSSPPAARGKSPDPNVPPMTKEKLVGKWQAFQGGTTGISLTLRDDQQFLWQATRDGKTRTIAGPYALEGYAIFLYGGSGTLIGALQQTKSKSFTFTLLDNAPADPGIEFARK